MEIQYIREFVALTKCGNYMTAAEELYISQSSLSKHIMALEKELGFSLFARTTRKVQLTQHGRLFLPYAQSIIEADAEFRARAAAANSDARESIQLGVLPSFLSYHLDQVIVDFKRRFPQFPISVTEGTSDTLVHQLREGICNVAVIRTYEESLPPDLVSIPIFEDRLALLIVQGSPWDDGRTSVTWKEMEQTELLTSSLQTKRLADLMDQEGLHLNILARMSRASSTVEMLNKNAGSAAMMNRQIAQYYQTRGAYKIIDVEPPLFNTVALLYRKESSRSAAIRHFVDIVRSFSAKASAPKI